MQLSFLYEEKALTEYQLYIASKSPAVTKTRNRNRWLLSLIYIAIGVFGIFKGDMMFTVMFIVIGILWYILYPVWGGKFYARHFSKFVKANYKNRFGTSVDLDFQTDKVVIDEAGQTAEFEYSEFETIIEIPQSFLIKLKSELIILIDKKATTSEPDVAAFFRQLTDRMNINYIQDTNWKWR